MALMTRRLLGAVLLALAATCAAAIKLDGVVLVVADADGGVVKSAELKHPSKSGEQLSLDHAQQLKVTFKASSSEVSRPQQAFLRLTSADSGAAAYFAAASAKGGALQASASAASIERQIGAQGGAFEAALVVADARDAAPVEWAMADVAVSHKPLPDGSQPPAPLTAMQALAQPKPAILHAHRTQEKRTPVAVALFFTAVVLAPLGGFIIGALKLGANLQGFPTSGADALRAALFHAGTAAILLLYLLFWLRLNLMQTLPALVALQMATRAAGWGLRVQGDARSKQD